MNTIICYINIINRDNSCKIVIIYTYIYIYIYISYILCNNKYGNHHILHKSNQFQSEFNINIVFKNIFI